ncbi:hypothetical protein [Phenylobacterium sp.]|jgi:hypothetical protein|uniref:hypothetical protein n=1 Tax=Phenylobacterium sp. TaxID=1871053 RepID=UPI002E3196B3|nr:hypothetical protein [Phenylobacterium sp.]HEX3364825.1 hypothetical protein [Phenylobacterium sp.]
MASPSIPDSATGRAGIRSRRALKVRRARWPIGVGLLIAGALSIGLWTLVAMGLRALFR